jgi:hypothetical protein
MAFNFRKR